MVRRLPFLFALLVSTYLFLTPIHQPVAGPENSDKVVHALLFLVLAVLGRYAGLPAVPLAIGLVLYAAGTETLQAILPFNRMGDVRDGLADTVGTALGLLLWRWFSGRRVAAEPVRRNRR